MTLTTGKPRRRSSICGPSNADPTRASTTTSVGAAPVASAAATASAVAAVTSPTRRTVRPPLASGSAARISFATRRTLWTSSRPAPATTSGGHR